MPDIDVVRSVAALRAAVRSRREAGARIGLVPTMGALHDGHLALVQAARDRGAAFVVATIFVNPLQFNPDEDLAAYPRDEAGDLERFAAAGVDLVFAPPLEEMYPPGFATEVRVSSLTRYLEGPARPGHFEGVATVVTKLLNQAQPDLACFGEKDFQQLQVIRRFARDLDLPVEIVGVTTVREADGLAMSSRNRYLSPAQRKIASALPQVMHDTVAELRGGGPSLQLGRSSAHHLGQARGDAALLRREIAVA